MPSACWWIRTSRAVIVEVVAVAPTTRLAPAVVAVMAVVRRVVVTKVDAETLGEPRGVATKVADRTLAAVTRAEVKERDTKAAVTKVDAMRVAAATRVVMTVAARKALVRKDDRKAEAAALKARDIRQIFRPAEAHNRVAVVAEADDAEAVVDARTVAAMKEAETIVVAMTETEMIATKTVSNQTVSTAAPGYRRRLSDLSPRSDHRAVANGTE